MTLYYQNKTKTWNSQNAKKQTFPFLRNFFQITPDLRRKDMQNKTKYDWDFFTNRQHRTKQLR